MGGLPVGVRVLGPLVLRGAVDNNPMADVVPRSRCAFSHSCSLDRSSLVSPVGEPFDRIGNCMVMSRRTTSLIWLPGEAVRAFLLRRNSLVSPLAWMLPSLLESTHPLLLS